MADAFPDDAVTQLRRICLELPGVTERLSHGEPTWFVNEKTTVATLDDHHHGADHLGFWCPAGPGAQEHLIGRDQGRFFLPPYVGVRGWIGVRIDKDPDWNEIAAIVEDAYRLVAPKRLVALLEG